MIPFIKDINENYINCFYCKNIFSCRKRAERIRTTFCKKMIIDERFLNSLHDTGDIVIESIEIIKHGILL